MSGQCAFRDCKEESWHGKATKCIEHRFSCLAPGCDRFAGFVDKARSGGLKPTGRYCSTHYRRLRVSGLLDEPVKPGPEWKPDAFGYMTQNTTRRGRSIHIKQHRVVMAEHLGRDLLPGENVHHKNGDRTDNRLENLELWSTSQPSGQRVADKVAWAKEILALYREDEFHHTA